MHNFIHLYCVSPPAVVFQSSRWHVYQAFTLTCPHKVCEEVRQPWQFIVHSLWLVCKEVRWHCASQTPLQHSSPFLSLFTKSPVGGLVVQVLHTNSNCAAWILWYLVKSHPQNNDSIEVPHTSKPHLNHFFPARKVQHLAHLGCLFLHIFQLCYIPFEKNWLKPRIACLKSWLLKLHVCKYGSQFSMWAKARGN